MTDGPLFGPFGISPEEAARLQDQARMAIVSIRHGIDSLFNNLGREDLVSLKQLLQQISIHENTKIATYFEGVADNILSSKYNVCPGCGTDHDEAMKDELEKAAKEAAEKSSNESQVHLETELDSEQIDGIALIEEINSVETPGPYLLSMISTLKVNPPSTPLEFDMMQDYDLDDLWERNDGEEATFLGYVCKKCGLRYRSIQDRMIKPVGDCHGCFTKAAHG